MGFEPGTTAMLTRVAPDWTNRSDSRKLIDITNSVIDITNSVIDITNSKIPYAVTEN